MTKKRNRHDNDELTIVSSMRPAYLCINAIQREHNCRYAMCYSCKMHEDDSANDRDSGNTVKRRSTRFESNDDGKSKIMRDKMNNKYDNDVCADPEALKYSCRHTDRRSLIPFTESVYFSKAYQSTIESKGIAFPMRCKECGLKLRGEND